MFCGYTSQTQIKTLVGGTLIDGFGGQPIYNGVIIIEEDKIIKVSHQSSTDSPENAEGTSVLSGLWDMHVHPMITGHGDYAHWLTEYINQFADIIAVKGDVLRWTPLLSDVDMVIKHGQRVK